MFLGKGFLKIYSTLTGEDPCRSAILRDLVDLLVRFQKPILAEDSVQLHSFIQCSL